MGWPEVRASCTSSARRAASSAPTVIAAVSARRTFAPMRTRGRPADRSAGDHPPSGPTSTVGSARATVRRPPRSASAAPGRSATSANVVDRVDPGQPRPAALHGRLPGDVGEPAGLAVGLGRVPSHDARSATNGTMRSTPSSVSFWTVSSGRSPLTRANATVIGGAGRGSATTSPAVVDLGAGPSRAARQCPRRRRPSPGRRGAGADPGQVVVVVRGQARTVEVVDEGVGARGERVSTAGDDGAPNRPT